ncbi:MAG: hypothetical protein KZQ85_17250 [Candidatus Thiodiazotropha sp. (ex Myrtea sp. 'scaly one' KF741663)]|nr:hypothetical protein [Candidatus Thiodiazotropha sp. (ex Myrtea sp. 'scaly one' KF741663)]
MNKISRALADISLDNRVNVVKKLKQINFNAVDLTPALRETYKNKPENAVKLAEAYAVTLQDPKQHREVFQQAALLPKEERMVLIQGYRNAGEGRGIVHAISQLPRQHGRLIMRDFVLKKNGKKDKEALHDVMIWLRDSGHEIRKMEAANQPINPDTDSAVVEFFEDVVDAISDAVTAVVDAIVDAVESLAQAIVDVANWIAEEVADLVRALIEAGKTIFELLEAAVVTGYQLVKKIVKAIEDIGKAMADVLEAAFNLAKDALVTVLKAIDQLSRTLGELLEWLATKTYDIVKRGVEALIEIGKSIGNILSQALQFTYTLIRNSVKALLEVGKTILEILEAAVTRPGDLFNQIVRSMRDLGNSLAELFDEVIDAGADLVKEIAEAAAEIGTTLVEFTTYIANAAIDIATKIVDGLLKAGKLIIDMVVEIASHGLEAIKKVVDAAFRLGQTLITLLRDVAAIAFDLLKSVVKAAFELGKTIAEFTLSMVEFTYRTAARFIEAALEVGAAVIEILEAVATASYYVLRKIINGVLQALGPVGDIFEWLLDRGEALASKLWRETVLAIRYVKRSVTDVMDWAMQQGQAFFDRMLEIFEDIGTAIGDVIDWAAAVGDAALEALGEATVKLGNSVSYVLNYLQKDFLPGLAKFVKGVLDVGYEIAKLAAWMATRSVEIVAEITKGALDAGVTLATLITETIKHPNQALENFLQAIDSLGQTLNDLYQAVIVDTGEQFIEEVTLTLRNIGRAVIDILNAVVEVAAGALGTVIGILMATLSSYRPLSDNEKADAREVYDDAIDLDDTYIAVESLVNDIIFGIQDFFTGNPQSRAFVTSNIINFDLDDAIDIDGTGTLGVPRHTLIHELCHVWQNEVEGPFYLSQAIHAQVVNDDAYNYGYDEGISNTSITIDYVGGTDSLDSGRVTGEGGQAELNAAGGDIDTFNREAQGQIAMHYFVRKILLNQPAANYQPWQPYIDAIRNAA